MYINYGDRDFFEYGILVDNDHSDTDIAVLYCRPYDDHEDLYLFADCRVAVDDSWINKNAVMEFFGMTEEDCSTCCLAIACIEYYGVENFSSPYDGYKFTRKEIEEKLKWYTIASDNLDITWK